MLIGHFELLSLQQISSAEQRKDIPNVHSVKLTLMGRNSTGLVCLAHVIPSKRLCNGCLHAPE